MEFKSIDQQQKDEKARQRKVIIQKEAQQRETEAVFSLYKEICSEIELVITKLTKIANMISSLERKLDSEFFRRINLKRRLKIQDLVKTVLVANRHLMRMAKMSKYMSQVQHAWVLEEIDSPRPFE
jgi:hypothetical protein